MSELNPYDSFIDDRALEAILSDTATEIGRLIAILGPEKSRVRPTPGKWSAAEVICHLADCEVVFAFRLRQTLAEDAPVIQPFDQDKWAAPYPGVPAAAALEAFAAMRNWNLLLIAKALPSAAGRTVTHPERGTMTFLTIVETMAGHDLNHLRQLQKLAAQ